MCQSAHELVGLLGHCCISWLEWLFWVSIVTTALLEMEAWCRLVKLKVLVRKDVDQHCCTWLVWVHVWQTWCMPWQIHWIEGNADFRFHVICPKIYRSQWTGQSHTVDHCQSEGLWGCHALKTSPSAVRQPCWCCSGWVEDVELRSSSSRSCPLPGGQFLLAWRYLWHTSSMGMMV